MAKKWQELRKRDTIIVATDTVAVAARCQKLQYMRVQWNPRHMQPIAKLNKKVSCGRFSTDFIPNDQPRFFCGSKALVTADLLTPAL